MGHKITLTIKKRMLRHLPFILLLYRKGYFHWRLLWNEKGASTSCGICSKVSILMWRMIEIFFNSPWKFATCKMSILMKFHRIPTESKLKWHKRHWALGICLKRMSLMRTVTIKVNINAKCNVYLYPSTQNTTRWIAGSWASCIQKQNHRRTNLKHSFHLKWKVFHCPGENHWTQTEYFWFAIVIAFLMLYVIILLCVSRIRETLRKEGALPFIYSTAWV